MNTAATMLVMVGTMPGGTTGTGTGTMPGGTTGTGTGTMTGGS